MYTGDEVAVPATKSYTVQLAAIAVIARAFGLPSYSLEGQLGGVPGAGPRWSLIGRESTRRGRRSVTPGARW